MTDEAHPFEVMPPRTVGGDHQVDRASGSSWSGSMP